MEKKKITRKVISAHPSKEGKVSKPIVEEVAVSGELASAVEVVTSVKDRTESSKDEARSLDGKVKKSCSFCQSKTIPTYTDISSLRRYLTERAKIQPKMRSGVCSKHQRAVSRNIKYARHLSLLPFVPKV